MPYNPDIHHRRSIRLREYDYSSGGAYFVTICTHQRECLFGVVVDGEMRLNVAGKTVREEWLKTATVRREIILDEFVIMPNHVHGIIFLMGNVGATRWVAQNESESATAGRATHRVDQNEPAGRRATHRVAPTGPVSGSVGAIIGQFKSIATKRINALHDTPGCPVWQRNYHEHIIREEDELTKVRRYIVENPSQWDLDENNPEKVQP